MVLGMCGLELADMPQINAPRPPRHATETAEAGISGFGEPLLFLLQPERASVEVGAEPRRSGRAA
jgi:hypothetical protein